ATGAAVGAGVVAGEALAHRLGGGTAGRDPVPPAPDAPASSSDDMGGNDFGISDGSSWDDAGGGGDLGSGSDWS
ncbi:MAG TPA: tetratricopeptide repeat protein, partial [Burkholderiales bacterium]|nr:tetratricopeptide repeat protein [Burkholderiales bacterium]